MDRLQTTISGGAETAHFENRDHFHRLGSSVSLALATASDRELSDALGRHEIAALDEAFRRHANQVARAARSVAGANFVDDVVQEVFLLLWRAPERFQAERGSLATYLTTLTRGKTIDAVRSHHARRLREFGFRQGQGDEVEDIVMAGVTAAQLQDALRTLPMTERVAIELAYFGGNTYREVATKLGHAEGTTKGRIRSGLRRLEAALQDIDVAEVA